MEENKTTRAPQYHNQYARERYYRAVVYHPVSLRNEIRPGTYPSWYIHTYTRKRLRREKEEVNRIENKRLVHTPTVNLRVIPSVLSSKRLRRFHGVLLQFHTWYQVTYKYNTRHVFM